MILHGLEDGLDGLAAEVVLPAGGEGIRLINEQHAADGLLNDLLGLERGLPHVARHEAGAVHLHKLALLQHADRGIEPREDAGHGGLAGAGVAEEDHVQAHRWDRQLVLLTELAHLHEVDEVLDVPLDLLQADKVLKLAHQLVKIWLLDRLLLLLAALLGVPAAGGLGLQLVLFHKARLAARDKLQGVERLLALAHACGVADGVELVGALGDIRGLAIAHIVVHGGQIQQDIGQHPDEGAGGLGAALGVTLREVPVEDRGQEDLPLADGAREGPEHPLGLGLVAGIDLVCHFHMALGDAAAPAPQIQGALGHELIELLGHGRAAEPVKGVGIGGIDFMELLRGAGPGGRHGRYLLYL